jgi:hypothetical protein
MCGTWWAPPDVRRARNVKVRIDAGNLTLSSDMILRGEDSLSVKQFKEELLHED